MVCHNDTQKISGSYKITDVPAGNATYFFVIENSGNDTQQVQYSWSFTTGSDFWDIVEITLLVILIILAVLVIVVIVVLVLLFFFATSVFFTICFCLKSKQTSYEAI